MTIRRSGARVAAAVTVAAVLAFAPLAFATQKFGPLQLSGNLQSQNLIRHPDATTYEFIQNRNTAHIHLDYDWLVGGKFYNKYEIPFVESSHLTVIWRGVYDSIYDTTPGFEEKEDIHAKAYNINTPQGENLYQYAKSIGRERFLRISSLTKGERDALKFDNQLREAYADIKLRTIPLTIRAGRQQIVWGETDNFRMLDRANPLDLTWHFTQELPAPAFGWDETRRPLWMFKFLYDVGDVWKLSQNFLEWYWNPGDWYPAKIAFLPRPWGVRFLDPLKNPIDGAFIGGVCDTVATRRNHPFNLDPNVGTCVRLMNNSREFEQGSYARNPLENSQIGVRYHGITPFGLEFTLNYFYQRWAGDDGTPYAPFKGLLAPTDNPRLSAINTEKARRLENQGIFPAEFIAPYVHTLGMSGNYSDEAYTQAVFRAETVYDVGIPFFDVGGPKRTVVDGLLPGTTNKNMWKGMIAFDRPTWIRSLNKKSTVFLTGQFFWHYLVNNPDCEAQTVAQLPVAQRNRVKSCLVGPFDLPSTVRLKSAAFRDKVRDLESIFTFAAFTFYRGGSIVPVVGIAVDPINQYAMEAFWTVDYVVRDDFVVNFAQRFMINPKGTDPLYSPWGLAGLNSGRSESSLRLTYQF